MEIIAPVRVTRSYVQRINAHPRDVFPLLCPVRETEWVPGWDPDIVFTSSGFAEPGCVFLTPDERSDSVWIVTDHDPDGLALRIFRVTPEKTVGKISILLSENAERTTDAWVTYEYTALSEEGVKFVQAYTEKYFVEFMQFWENALNEYIEKQRDQ